MLRQVITISLLAFPIFGYTQPGVQMYPPKEELGVIVFDKGTGLDTSCRFRSEGPLVIDIPIPAVVNEKEINADGTLKVTGSDDLKLYNRDYSAAKYLSVTNDLNRLGDELSVLKAKRKANPSDAAILTKIEEKRQEIADKKKELVELTIALRSQ